MLRCCECGSVDFIVRFRQISTYDACMDINIEDVHWDGEDEEIESVETVEEDGYTCENCGKFYASMDDMPELDADYYDGEETDEDEDDEEEDNKNDV